MSSSRCLLTDEWKTSKVFQVREDFLDFCGQNRRERRLDFKYRLGLGRSAEERLEVTNVFLGNFRRRCTLRRRTVFDCGTFLGPLCFYVEVAIPFELARLLR